MGNIYETLSWLPLPPDDFSQRLSATTDGAQLRELAKYSLDDNQLRRLSRKLSSLQDDGRTLKPLTSVSIGILSNATTKLIVPAMVGSALRFGIALNVIEAEFNQVAQEAFSAETAFAGASLSAILISIDYRGLPLIAYPGDVIAATNNVQDCVAYIKSVIEAVRAKTGSQIILQNIAQPPDNIFGSYEGRLPGTITWIIRRLNLELDSLVSSDTFILDVDGLSANIGVANWNDPTLWNMAKLPFSQKFAPIYADYICRILAARLGKSRRCLILDLDNTVWGGIIGDDGLEGILIGNGDPTAEAHSQVQKTALDLRNRGVVLAISSKNEDSIARQPFKGHPDMLLREEHIAVFQANWSDKASNIKAIAQRLSLGFESMVFLDDNPAERMLVRRELPEVAVPELPNDPALYARTLIAAGYFEAVTFSEEDRKRASFYQDNAKRAQIMSQSSDMDEYLKSLEMEISLTSFDEVGRPRIVQLISKSNQFNLTTTRYSEAEIKEIENSANFYTRQIRLKDVLGDNGMISVVICRKYSSVWEIDTWLMSCRVLGRRVEQAVLQDIVLSAKAAGVYKLVGIYKPTPRNIIVKDHYSKMNFTKISEDAQCEKWALDLNTCGFEKIPFSYNNMT